MKISGFDTGDSTTHIIPIILSDEDTVMNAKAKLLDQGIIVSAIRQPTVPPGTSRLRVALNVNHSKENIDRLMNVLKQV